MKYQLYNVGLDLINRDEFFETLKSFLNSDKCNLIGFLNAHCFNIAQKDSEYLNAINNCDLFMNDGIGIKIACLLNGRKQKENMNGTDLIPEIIGFSGSENR